MNRRLPSLTPLFVILHAAICHPARKRRIYSDGSITKKGVNTMGLFKKRQPEPEITPFDPARFEPVIRASICTGERVACMRERETGKLHELMLIRTDEDVDLFRRRYQRGERKIRTVY